MSVAEHRRLVLIGAGSAVFTRGVARRGARGRAEALQANEPDRSVSNDARDMVSADVPNAGSAVTDPDQARGLGAALIQAQAQHLPVFA